MKKMTRISEPVTREAHNLENRVQFPDPLPIKTVSDKVCDLARGINRTPDGFWALLDWVVKTRSALVHHIACGGTNDWLQSAVKRLDEILEVGDE